MVVKIARIHTLNDVTLKQLRQIAVEFKVKGKTAELGFSDLRTTVQTCQVFTDKFGKYDPDIPYHFCFGRNSQFVCTLAEFSKDSHQFVIPQIFQHGDINTSDKKKEVLLKKLRKFMELKK